MSEPYSPLDRRNLGESVMRRLIGLRPEPLASLDRLIGAGIYAIYYTGAFPAYRPLVAANANHAWNGPI